MSVTPYTSMTAASRVLDALLALLSADGIVATRDPGAFYPHPVGVLVGPPALRGRGIASWSFAVRVLVVSGDPLASIESFDRLYSLADDVALALSCNEYAASSYQTTANSEPLPAVELQAVCSVTLT